MWAHLYNCINRRNHFLFFFFCYISGRLDASQQAEPLCECQKFYILINCFGACKRTSYRITLIVMQLHPDTLWVCTCGKTCMYTHGYPCTYICAHLCKGNSVTLACLSIIRFMTARFRQSWNVFKLKLKRPDTVTTTQWQMNTKESRRKNGEMEGKTKKKGSVFVGLRFQQQSRPMHVSEDKEGDEEGMERERDTERGIKREGKAERERDTQFSMKRTAGWTVRPLSGWPG